MWVITSVRLLTLRPGCGKIGMVREKQPHSTQQCTPFGFGQLDRVRPGRAGTRMRKPVVGSTCSPSEVRTAHPTVCCSCFGQVTTLHSSDRPRSIYPADSLEKHPEESRDVTTSSPPYPVRRHHRTRDEYAHPGRRLDVRRMAIHPTGS